ncbi:hypothetical protein G9C98_000060 [Cotesia typhae]|uniref:Uncharacterized protein n=1 Tax=Cotesia typhae TaxID=2053667 RepID=A0A8J5RKY8_9HYME|nr:hypothetical protein G9C98_000060 [Cotesia typhae]
MGNLTTVVRFGAALLPYLVDYVVGTNDTLADGGCRLSVVGCWLSASKDSLPSVSFIADASAVLVFPL